MIDTKIFKELSANEMFDTCINDEDSTSFRNDFFGITFYVDNVDAISFKLRGGSYVSVCVFEFIVEAYKIFSEAFGKDRMYWFN